MTGSRQLVLAVAILGSLYATASIGAGRESLSDKIEKERKTLDQLKDQIEETRKQADEAGKKRESGFQGLQTPGERVGGYHKGPPENNPQHAKKKTGKRKLSPQK